LYETDRAAFDDEFGKHIEKRREERPQEYITNLLHRIVQSDKKIPCLVFDNADHFTIDFQERVFQFAHALYREVLCLILIPITDKTSWQLSRQGALQSFFTDSFFLPTPPTEVVLQKRIEFIERRLAEDEKPETGKGYFFGRGIDLSIENLRGFTNGLQAVFISTGQMAAWIGDLANRDIRRCLQLTREIVASPYIKVHDLLGAFVTHTTIAVSPEDAKMAIIRGKYDIYPTGQSAFIQNLYALTTEIVTSPLLGVRILRLLDETNYQQAEGEARYLAVDQIVQYCSGMNFEPRAVRSWLDAMLKCGLCLSYDPTAAGIDKTARVEIAPSGRQHLDWAMKDWTYIEAMMEVTPLFDRQLHQEISHLIGADMPYARRKALRSFLTYLLKEDERYALIPAHAMYADQQGLKGIIEQEVSRLGMPVSTTGPSRFGRPFGKVARWFADKGYGFVTPDGTNNSDAFVHVRDFVVNSGENVPVGTMLEFDLVPGAERRMKAVRVAVLD
jgi:cold shock CspA family protein